jgi:hypothetical protein
MWTKKILSMLLTGLTLLTLLASCATVDKSTTLPSDHRPPPTSGGP